jgi:rhamnosyltransferase
MAQEIVASILSWNPDVGTVRRSLTGLKRQVDHVVICDNNSRPELKKELEDLGREFSGFITFVWNKENVGNAGGLNCGVKAALDENAYWVMPIDDDSVPYPNMVATMLAAYNMLSPNEQDGVGRVAPNYTTAKGLAFPENGDPFISDGAISSGEIVKAELYKKIGLYQEDLFVDCVDSEFSHRAFRAGARSLIVPKAVLFHQAGEPIIRKFLWITAAVPNYPPSRYYYIARNNAYLYIRHFNEYFLHGANKSSKIWVFLIPRYLIKAILFEDRKAAKIRMVMRGTWDGLRGKLGKLK